MKARESQLLRELESLRQKLERQRKLVEASYALHSTLDLDELLGRILNTAVEGVFGTERLGIVLAGARDQSPGEIVRTVREAVRCFTGQVATSGPRRECGPRTERDDDDLTIVVVKHEGVA
jgi:hypothetical protein